jgi:hypothetical protein
MENIYESPCRTTRHLKEEIVCGEHENQRRQCNSPLRARTCSMKHRWRWCNGDAKKRKSAWRPQWNGRVFICVCCGWRVVIASNMLQCMRFDDITNLVCVWTRDGDATDCGLNGWTINVCVDGTDHYVEPRGATDYLPSRKYRECLCRATRHLKTEIGCEEHENQKR